MQKCWWPESPMLRDLQRAFSAAVFENRPGLSDHLLPGRFPSDRLTQVYRGNVAETLTAALAAVYPAVERLVSPGFFAYAAHEYLRHHRPLSANLHDFGGAFADFLAGFPPAMELPYLPDMARLEWAWHRAFHAAEGPAFEINRLIALPVEQLATVRIGLKPSAQIVSSRYPIVRIFETNRIEGSDGGFINLEAGGETVLVIRRGLSVSVESLGTGEAALLTALHQNRILDDALAAALAVQPDFDLNPVLADHTRRGTFSGFHTI